MTFLTVKTGFLNSPPYSLHSSMKTFYACLDAISSSILVVLLASLSNHLSIWMIPVIWNIANPIIAAAIVEMIMLFTFPSFGCFSLEAQWLLS